MIINSSRAQIAMKCWRQAFNRHHRRLSGERSMNLTDGGAVHEGIAHGLATKDWTGAIEAARKKFEVEVEGSLILPEERGTIAQHWEMVEALVEVFSSHYEGENYQVLQPECEFDVVLPNSEHNCVFVHHYRQDLGEFRTGTPEPEAILRGDVKLCHFCNSDTTNPHLPGSCWQPHRLVGKADALVHWKNSVWLLEHKTTAILGPQFWDQWMLDIQPTTYLYGIWRSLGIRPAGFVINALFKPSERQVASWASRRKTGPAAKGTEYIRYEREAFLRTEEDLMRVEGQYIDLCNEWEQRIASGKFPMSNIRTNCQSYNRLCDYHGMCVGHETPDTMESFQVDAPLDYVEEKLVQILGAGV